VKLILALQGNASVPIMHAFRTRSELLRCFTQICNYALLCFEVNLLRLATKSDKCQKKITACFVYDFIQQWVHVLMSFFKLSLTLFLSTTVIVADLPIGELNIARLRFKTSNDCS